MKRFPVCVAAAAVAALMIPTGADAATRTGAVQDPQGDASALSGPVLDLASFAVAYDDVAGTLRMTWSYYGDIRNSLPGSGALGGAASVGNPVTVNVPTDNASIEWSGRQESNGTWAIPTTLRLSGSAGSLAGTGGLSADGRTVTAEFTNPTLAGHDWQHATGAPYNGDTFERFWFDGFQPAPAVIPPPVAAPPGGGSTPPASSDPVPGTAGGPTGMSINNGAQYTNDPAVTLAVIAPAGVDALRVANDGGFLKARRFRIASTIKWKLEESGSERLPKTVYLRFGNQVQTFTDDIILDQTKPTLASATLVRSASSRAAETRAASKKRTFRVRLGAKDATSGVGSVQFAVKKRRPSKPTKFRRVVATRATSAPRYVRVRDRAGNYSAWRTIR